MAGYSWIFFVSPDTITEVTATDGVTTVTVQATGGGMTVPFFETSAFPETTEVTLSAAGYNKVTAIVGTTSSVTFTEGGYSWGFTAPASSITITNGTNTYTYTGMAIPMGGYSYTVTDFDENDEVTISAVGYNKVTATVGDVTIVMTEMPEVEVLNPNGTSYAIADAKARQQVADLETNVYNDLQNYVTTAAMAGLLEAIYPVGSVYIGTQATCPMSTVMSGTTWTLVSSGKALWTGTGSNGNTTIAAGLPNITGQAETAPGGENYACSGALKSNAILNRANTYSRGERYTGTLYGVEINAARSSSIYGNSTTVQPPAYVVNVWRRTA